MGLKARMGSVGCVRVRFGGARLTPLAVQQRIERLGRLPGGLRVAPSGGRSVGSGRTKRRLRQQPHEAAAIAPHGPEKPRQQIKAIDAATDGHGPEHDAGFRPAWDKPKPGIAPLSVRGALTPGSGSCQTRCTASRNAGLSSSQAARAVVLWSFGSHRCFPFPFRQKYASTSHVPGSRRPRPQSSLCSSSVRSQAVPGYRSTARQRRPLPGREGRQSHREDSSPPPGRIAVSSGVGVFLVKWRKPRQGGVVPSCRRWPMCPR